MLKTEVVAPPSIADSTQVEVSVAMVSWNASEFLGPCLRSIYNNHGDRVEIILVDNASTDGSADLAERDFPETLVVRNDDNLGFAKATNQAIRLSRGRYVLLLNPDTVLQPSAIPSMIEFLESHPHVAAVGPKILGSDGQTIESYSPFPGLAMVLRGIRIIATASYHCTLPPTDTKPKPVDWICGACMLVRREALEQVGLLDEGFFMYWEETDLCWRFWRHGWEVYYLPQTCIVHHVAKSSAQADDKIFLNGLLLNEWINSAHRFLRKHYPLWVWVACTAVACFSILVAFIILPVIFIAVPSRREQVRTILTTYIRALSRHAKEGITSLFARWDISPGPR